MTGPTLAESYRSLFCVSVLSLIAVLTLAIPERAANTRPSPPASRRSASPSPNSERGIKGVRCIFVRLKPLGFGGFRRCLKDCQHLVLLDDLFGNQFMSQHVELGTMFLQ